MTSVSSSRFTTTLTTTSGGSVETITSTGTTIRTQTTRGTSTTSRSIVTVNAAPVQTGMMAMGALFGGAAVLVNM